MPSAKWRQFCFGLNSTIRASCWNRDFKTTTCICFFLNPVYSIQKWYQEKRFIFYEFIKLICMSLLVYVLLTGIALLTKNFPAVHFSLAKTATWKWRKNRLLPNKTSTIRTPTFWEYPRSLPMNKFQTRSPINELGGDLDPRYVPTKFDHDRRRIALGRAVTDLAGQNDQLAQTLI